MLILHPVVSTSAGKNAIANIVFFLFFMLYNMYWST